MPVRYTEGTLPTDFEFTGQRKDSYIKLLDYHSRFYDPLVGRFVSADTIIPDLTDPQSLNRYSYVLGNPLKYQDPSGHNPILGVMLIVAGVAALAVEIPMIQEHAERNDMTFWEAAVDEDLYLDQAAMANAAVEAAIKVPEAVVGIYMLATMGGSGLQQAGMTFDSTRAWNGGTALQNAAAQWGAFWTGVGAPDPSLPSMSRREGGKQVAHPALEQEYMDGVPEYQRPYVESEPFYRNPQTGQGGYIDTVNHWTGEIVEYKPESYLNSPYSQRQAQTQAEGYANTMNQLYGDWRELEGLPAYWWRVQYYDPSNYFNPTN